MFSRFTHKVAVKVGRAKTTKDDEFEQLASELSEVEKQGKHVADTAKAFASQVKSENKALAKLTKDLATFTEQSDLCAAGARTEHAASDAQVASETLHEEIVNNFVVPLSELLKEISGLRRQQDDRNRKCMDMDRLERDLQSQQEKSGASEQRIAQVEEKAERAREAYETVNTEVKEAMRTLLDSRADNFQPIMQRLLENIHEYYSDAARAVEAVASVDIDHGSYQRPVVASEEDDLDSAPPARSPHGSSTTDVQPSRAPPSRPPARRPPPTAPAVPRAQAMYDFNAEEANELSFKAGDILTIVSSEHGDWWHASLNGAEGMVPASYLSML